MKTSSCVCIHRYIHIDYLFREMVINTYVTTQMKKENISNTSEVPSEDPSIITPIVLFSTILPLHFFAFLSLVLPPTYTFLNTLFGSYF